MHLEALDMKLQVLVRKTDSLQLQPKQHEETKSIRNKMLTMIGEMKAETALLPKS